MEASVDDLTTRIVKILVDYRYRCLNELDLQDGIAASIETTLGRAPEREWHLGRDRLDLFMDGVAIEVKIDGPLSSVTRQLHRYAQHPNVKAIVLATTRMLHLNMPAEINGKTILVVLLRTSGF